MVRHRWMPRLAKDVRQAARAAAQLAGDVSAETWNESLDDEVVQAASHAFDAIVRGNGQPLK